MRRLLAFALAAGALPATLPAQNTKSQLGSVSQSVMSAKVTVTYRRPVARGRTLFGTLVPWGEVWTPSADSAARITLTEGMDVNGSKLAAGSYGIWVIPDSASWTIIFNSVPEVFHRSYPRDRDVLRVRAVPTHGDHVETLMFAFPVVDADSARLELRWGTTVVPLTLRIAR